MAARIWSSLANLAVLEESKQVRARYRRDRLDLTAYDRGKTMTHDEAIDFALQLF